MNCVLTGQLRRIVAAWLILICLPSMHAQSDVKVPAGIAAKGKINHVVIIVQENRTFDNIFGGFGDHRILPAPFPGAEATFPAEIAPLMRSQQFGGPGSINASHDVWQCLYSSGFTSDAWKHLNGSNCNGTYHGHDPISSNPFNYLAVNLRETYWDIAKKYVLGDHFFAITSTSSFPGHQYIVAEQSKDTSGDTVADQPRPGNGCFDGDNGGEIQVSVPALGDDGYIKTVTRDLGGECYNNKTLPDLISRKMINVTWTNYVTVQYNPQTGKFERSLMFDGFINIQKWYKATTRWPTSMDDLQHDIASRPLANITWVKPPCGQLSDHPGGVSTNDSANWAGSVINWIGASKNWDDTVIFVVWDDWGGFYDHVVPPQTRSFDKLGPGLRTPFLMISPYGVNGKVVKSQADYSSIVKFIEDLFDLGSLNEIDKNAPDLAPFFDFSSKQSFVPVKVKRTFVPSMCPKSAIDRRMIDP